MSNPFAAVESALNAAALAVLGNAAATVAGIPVDGVLDDNYRDALGVAASGPVFTCLSADVENAVYGDAVVISGIAYTLRGIQPDGTGLTRLVLEEA